MYVIIIILIIIFIKKREYITTVYRKRENRTNLKGGVKIALFALFSVRYGWVRELN